jgi:G:T/U-mismatch repair DNA glycosylase
MRTHLFVSSLLIVAGAACASSQADQVRDARMEQIDQQTVASTRAIEDRQESREEAIERRHDMAVKRVEAVDPNDDGAALKRLEIAQERAAYESKSQGQIETIGVRLRAAEQKMVAVGAKVPVNLQAELETLAKEHRILEKDVKNLSDTPVGNWESTKDTLDDRISDLNDRVKELTSSIEDA